MGGRITLAEATFLGKLSPRPLDSEPNRDAPAHLAGAGAGTTGAAFSDLRIGGAPLEFTGAVTTVGLVKLSTPMEARPGASARITSARPSPCQGWNWKTKIRAKK